MINKNIILLTTLFTLLANICQQTKTIGPHNTKDFLKNITRKTLRTIWFGTKLTAGCTFWRIGTQLIHDKEYKGTARTTMGVGLLCFGSCCKDCIHFMRYLNTPSHPYQNIPHNPTIETVYVEPQTETWNNIGLNNEYY